jgi:hypothetical protein
MSLLGNIFGFISFFLLLLYFTGCFHVINYGNIGVYKRGGALLSTWTEPGLHFMIPFITTYYPVQVNVQTDKVTDIPVPLPLRSAEPVAASSSASRRSRSSTVSGRSLHIRPSRITRSLTIRRGFSVRFSTSLLMQPRDQPVLLWTHPPGSPH